MEKAFFYKDYLENPMEIDDISSVLSLNGEAITEESITANRLLAELLFLAEKYKGSIRIERDENNLKITICKNI